MVGREREARAHAVPRHAQIEAIVECHVLRALAAVARRILVLLSGHRSNSSLMYCAELQLKAALLSAQAVRCEL